WALLVGVDFYKDQPLRGAVRDVNVMKAYLESHYKSVDIKVLTAPMDLASADQFLLPTRGNLISALERTTDKAQTGDFVHIHYSGHGVSTPVLSQSSNEEVRELALDLYEHDSNQSARLLGSDLVHRLKAMGDKGLVVTLVLDCCFSGSVRRKDYKDFRIRTRSKDGGINTSSRDSMSSSLNSSEILRGAQVRERGLLHPEKYAIITACDVHEEAGEDSFEDRKVHGALSFMLDTALRSHSTNISFYSLFQDIVSQFDEKYPRQKPKFFGNHRASFFGRLMWKPDLSSVCVFSTDGGIYLEAGAAHGVELDDEYTVHPPSSLESGQNFEETPEIRAMVTEVRGLNSTLNIKGAESRTSRPIKTGWKAKVVKRGSLHKIPVRIDLEGNLANQGVITADDRQFWYPISSLQEDQSCAITVQQISDRIEFLDGQHHELPHVPPIVPFGASFLSELTAQIDHLATYTFFSRLHNPDPDPKFSESFSISLKAANGVSFHDKAFTNHNDEEELKLSVLNTSPSDPLYLSIFSLSDEYEVENIYHTEQVKTMPRKSSRTLHIGITITDGFSKSEDTIKVFVTSRPTLFAQFWLPKLS
ncbi:hypothetical protein EV356DRAFT_423697, partial [Viridothelium virens]